MALTFYPHTEDTQRGTLTERIAVLLDAAERYISIILEHNTNPAPSDPKKRMVPRDMVSAYNWEEIARILREIRELPELNKADKARKADALIKLAEVYEVLRGAKMAKLEAVRLALVGEASQLGGTAQVA